MTKINCNLINFSICLSDLSKGQLKKADNGKIYLNGVIAPRKEIDKFGNDLNIFFPKSKEEKELKAVTVYIPGNAKSVSFNAAKPPEMSDEPPTKEELDNLSF